MEDEVEFLFITSSSLIGCYETLIIVQFYLFRANSDSFPVLSPCCEEIKRPCVKSSARNDHENRSCSVLINSSFFLPATVCEKNNYLSSFFSLFIVVVRAPVVIPLTQLDTRQQQRELDTADWTSISCSSLSTTLSNAQQCGEILRGDAEREKWKGKKKKVNFVSSTNKLTIAWRSDTSVNNEESLNFLWFLYGLYSTSPHHHHCRACCNVIEITSTCAQRESW